MSAPIPQPSAPDFTAGEICALAQSKCGVKALSTRHYTLALGAVSNLYCLYELSRHENEPIQTEDFFVSHVATRQDILTEIGHAVGSAAGKWRDLILSTLIAAMQELVEGWQIGTVRVVGFGTFRYAKNGWELVIQLPLQGFLDARHGGRGSASAGA